MEDLIQLAIAFLIPVGIIFCALALYGGFLWLDNKFEDHTPGIKIKITKRSRSLGD